MRISLLLKREPFGQILEQTLSLFLCERFGKAFHVKWHKRLSPFRSYSSGQVWLCNPYINAVFVSRVNRVALLPIIQEFSYSIAAWRRPLQGLYVRLAADRYLSRFFSWARLEIDPSINHPEDILILGGNHHIRFHDYSQEKAFVITKTGFNQDLMRRDISVREGRPYLPCPNILEKSPSGSWYAEDLILGTPVNRLQDQAETWTVIRKVQERIARLYNETAKQEGIGEYSTGLYDEILNQTRQKHILDGNILKRVLDAAQILVDFPSKEFKNAKVTIVQSHGDFQPANILAGETDFWLIDWEYTARRQAAYDALVLVLSSRFPVGLSCRIRDALLDNLGSREEAFLLRTPFIDWRNVEMRVPQIALFLLEDLCLKIRENANPLFAKLEQGFFIFLNEMEKALVILQLK